LYDQEVTVKPPRFSIAWLMVAVAIAAIDFGVIRASLEHLTTAPVGLLVVGALPMANMLIVGMLIARQRPGSRPFLWGFELFGATALAVYIHLATSSHRDDGGPLTSYVRLAIDPIAPVIRGYQPFVSFAIEVFVGVVMFVGPQFAFALIGGFLSRRFIITVARR
jgi:hypothetical protein